MNDTSDLLRDDIKKLVMEQLSPDTTEEELTREIERILGELRQGMDKSYSLKECLHILNKEDLVSIAKTNKLRGYSKLRKDELVDFLYEYLRKEAFMTKIYTSLLSRDLNILGEVGAERMPLISTDVLYAATDLLHYGVCYLDESHKYLVMPEELKELYWTLDNDPDLEEQQLYYTLIYEECLAAVYLYGICPISTIRERLLDELDIQIEEQELIDVINDAYIQRGEFYFHNGNIISTALQNTPEDIIILQQLQQQKKRFFWPDMAQFEILSMEEWLIDEAAYEPFFELSSYMMDNDFGDILGVARFVESSIRTGAPFNALMGFLSEKIFMFDTEEQVQNFTQIMQNIWDNTPMWENCGYTPRQLREPAQKSSPKIVSLHEHRKKKNRKKKKNKNKNKKRRK